MPIEPFELLLSFLYRISSAFPGGKTFNTTVDFFISQFESPTGSAVAAHSLCIRTIEDDGFILILPEKTDELFLAFSSCF